MRAGELLDLVLEAMREDLLRVSHVQADETVVRCKCTTSAELIIERTLGNKVPGGETVFEF